MARDTCRCNESFGDDPDDEVAHRQASEKVDRPVAYLRMLQATD